MEIEPVPTSVDWRRLSFAWRKLAGMTACNPERKMKEKESRLHPSIRTPHRPPPVKAREHRTQGQGRRLERWRRATKKAGLPFYSSGERNHATPANGLLLACYAKRCAYFRRKYVVYRCRCFDVGLTREMSGRQGEVMLLFIRRPAFFFFLGYPSKTIFHQ